MSWAQFKSKHGLHDCKDPVIYAGAVYSATMSFMHVMENADCMCDYEYAKREVTSKLAHLEELKEALR
ncbi:hypothetical protein LCGC14_2737740 [marine sediment metagenome]|uniref:Uncharacterized protein n=1 Tax=marine sediment metagenome TaxID=412755 RepID=A0A0F8Z5D5_9ZZZZ|nr:hypothetical protein [bacterium]